MKAVEGHAPFDDLEPWGYGDRLETQIFVFGLELAVPLAVLAFLLVSWWRRRRRAARAEVIEASAVVAAPVPGESVVRGVVAEIEDGDAAVRVTVVQKGREHKGKHGWRTTWSEVDRRIEARPFQLELQGGQHLRVEPGPDARLIDDLDSWRRTEAATRAASATLQRGETVFVHGEIVSARAPQAGYRGGEALVLRPPRGRPMSLSTHGLAAPEREAARHIAGWAWRVVLVIAAAQLFALPYHVSRWFGETRSATIVQRWTTQTKRKNRVEQNHFVRYQVAGGSMIIEEHVDEEHYPLLTEGRVVPVRVTPLQTTIGPNPTLHGLLVLPTTMFVLGLLGFALYGSFRARAWYEMRLEDHVDGRLSEQG